MAEEKAFTELFHDQVKDLYSAEKQIMQALPKMAKKSTNPQLRAGFEKHLEETRGHVARLEQIAAELDFSPRGKKCKGAEGLIEEGKEAMEEFEGDVLDAALIGAAQRVEHYEMAGYGTARAMAALYQMMLAGGELNGTRIVSPRTLQYAIRNHTADRVDEFMGMPMHRGLGPHLRGTTASIRGLGAFASPGSCERDRCVFAMQIGKWP